MNPCQCGHAGDSSGLCHCTAEQISRYRSRISGPLLDRIDLQVEVARPEKFLDESEGPTPECSARVRERVIAARAVQLRRRGTVNAHLDFDGLRQHCRLDDAGRKLLADASDRHALSPRACHRILRVSRTLADLDGAAAIGAEHLAEAISYHASSSRADRRY